MHPIRKCPSIVAKRRAFCLARGGWRQCPVNPLHTKYAYQVALGHLAGRAPPSPPLPFRYWTILFA